MDASIGDVIRTIMDETPPSPSWIVGNPGALFATSGGGGGASFPDDEPIPFTVVPTAGQAEAATRLAEMAARGPESAGAHDEAPTNPEWTPWADLEGDGPPADALAPLTSWVSPDGSIEGYVDVVASPGDDIVKLDAWVNEALQRRFEDPRTRIHQRNPRQGCDDAAYKPLRYTFRLDSPLHDSLLKRGLAPEHGDAIIAGNAEPNGQLYDLPDTEINDDRKRLWANWTVAFDEGPEGFTERGA